MKQLPYLNVGAGSTPKKAGSINADFYPGPNIDVVFDATQAWPFEDGSIGVVQSNHMLEHLHEPWNFFREAWRVLVPSPVANLYIRVPYGPSEGGLGDMHHLRYFVPSSFACVQPRYISCSKNPQYESWDAPFEVVAIYQRINPALRWLVKPVIRRWGQHVPKFLWGGYCELIVGLRKLKRGEGVPQPGAVPVADVMYEHEYEGRVLQEGEEMRLLFFGEQADELQRQQDARGDKHYAI